MSTKYNSKLRRKKSTFTYVGVKEETTDNQFLYFFSLLLSSFQKKKKSTVFRMTHANSVVVVDDRSVSASQPTRIRAHHRADRKTDGSYAAGATPVLYKKYTRCHAQPADSSEASAARGNASIRRSHESHADTQ